MQVSLNIGIVGYGKMGHMVESIAEERGHGIAFIAAGKGDPWQAADVIIEFSRPESALSNIRKAISSNIPMVTGTTGWQNHLSEIKTEVEDADASILHASNFSVGVNMTFVINERLAALMQSQPSYSVSIEETHHTEKLDSPSGTAISLGQGIIKAHKGYSDWKESDTTAEGIIPIIAHREPDVPGTHIVRWENEIDRIELKHEAKSRRGFALGAVIAAEWLHGRTGLFTMRDVLHNII
jgi:4-hydroxy-tetrahydrodipicolinate reductase